MMFSLFQTTPVQGEDDIATGTYADGAAGTPRIDLSGRRRDGRSSSHERDYGAERSVREAGVGFVA